MTADDATAHEEWSTVRDRNARSFGQAAGLYDAARPNYPAAALEWMLGAEPLDVVDVGAGTGLLTRGIIALGHRVTAVEPDAQMLETLVAASPGLAAHRIGSAEELPLADASADVVTAGQAYHWFEPERALPEIRRVLRPGGVFAPIWNVRDGSVDWIKALTEIIGESQGEHDAALAARPGAFAPWFDDPETRIFRHELVIDGTGLVRLVQSRSFYLVADEAKQREITSAVEALVREHPQLAGRETFPMPYTTHVYRARPADD